MTPQMKRMLIYVSIVLGIVFGIYGGKKIIFMVGMSFYKPPAITISSATATPKTWQSFINSVGTLKAVNGTDISAEVSGIVKEIHFESGQNINQGDLLVQLDTSVEEAQLKNDNAKLQLAQINNDRNQTLLKKNVLSQSAFDASVAELEEAKANVQATQAKIKQKTITAPFAGKIGIRQINIGDYLSAGAAMVTLQALDPLYVEFNLPEQYLAQLYPQQPVDLTINGNNKQTTVFHGVITAINSKVDQTTRNMLIQATIPNKDLLLFPGMFVQVKVWLRAQKNVITLPQTAISYSLHGDAVFLIQATPEPKHGFIVKTFHKIGKFFGKKSKPFIPEYHVVRQYVKTGELRGDEVAIMEGIKAGDLVVSSGQLKLQNHSLVVIDNSVEI